jgi:hypothetical protein
MSIITDVLTAGVNNHQTTSEAGNFFATDMITDGVVGAITNTSGVAPATGAWAVNQNTGADMNVAISAGVGYVTATPTGQNSQRLRARNTATITQAIASNSTGSTRYDWIYYSVNANNANTPNAAADNVTSITVSRSTSNTVDNGTPPTYGKNIAIVTVTNGATGIVNGNIADTRVQAGASAVGTGAVTNSALAANSAWTSWTPTWTNLTVGNGVGDYKYQQIGKTVHFRLKFTLGTTSAVGVGPRFTLPVNSTGMGDNDAYAIGTALDVGIAAYYAFGRFGTASTCDAMCATASGAYIGHSNIGTATPFTWGTGDIIQLTGTYEAA